MPVAEAVVVFFRRELADWIMCCYTAPSTPFPPFQKLLMHLHVPLAVGYWQFLSSCQMFSFAASLSLFAICWWICAVLSARSSGCAAGPTAHILTGGGRNITGVNYAADAATWNSAIKGYYWHMCDVRTSFRNKACGATMQTVAVIRLCWHKLPYSHQWGAVKLPINMKIHFTISHWRYTAIAMRLTKSLQTVPFAEFHCKLTANQDKWQVQ